MPILLFYNPKCIAKTVKYRMRSQFEKEILYKDSIYFPKFKHNFTAN